VETEAGDEVAPWLLTHDEIDEPVQRVFLDLIEEDANVIDLGCHLGVFALPAAAAGANVTAVDAAPRHVELVARAAERNGFDRLETVNAAIGSTGGVDFIERSIHGRVWVEGDPVSPTVTVPSITVDELVAARGWEGVDLVKLDIEGLERAALAGMRGIFAAGQRPALVIEINATTLPLFGASTYDLRRDLELLGYVLYLVDDLRPGTLVEAGSRSLQPEAASNYLAVPRLPARLRDRWRVEGAFGRRAAVARLLDQATSEAPGYRLHAARLLLDHPELAGVCAVVGPAVAALGLDLEPGVAELRPSENGTRPVVFADGDALPETIAAWVAGVAARERVEELPRLQPLPLRADEDALADVSLVAVRGELLGVMADDPRAGRLLVRTLAGLTDVVDGELDVVGRRVLLTPLDGLAEVQLTVGENVAVVAAAAGGHVAQARERAFDLAVHAGVKDRLDVPLGRLSANEIARVVVGAAVACGADDLVLLLDGLPVLDDVAFREWLHARVAELLARGGTIVQVAADPAAFLVPPRRIAWFDRGRTSAFGHAESVADAYQRRRLSLDAERSPVA
jgi:teichoic acid transport system ATP-binding protein